MEEHRKVVGQRLRDLRKARGMNQEDAAHAVGVAVKTWSNWERGATAPYDSNWKKIRETFDVDTADIIGTPPAPLGLGRNPAGNPGETPESGDTDRLSAIEAKLDQVLTEQRAIRGLLLRMLPPTEAEEAEQIPMPGDPAAEPGKRETGT